MRGLRTLGTLFGQKPKSLTTFWANNGFYVRLRLKNACFITNNGLDVRYRMMPVIKRTLNTLYVVKCFDIKILRTLGSLFGQKSKSFNAFWANSGFYVRLRFENECFSKNNGLDVRKTWAKIKPRTRPRKLARLQ